MKTHPRLDTARLKLRPFLADDAEALVEHVGSPALADTMLDVPHPLSISMARSIIAANAVAFQDGRSVHFALRPANEPDLIGAVELVGIAREDRSAELRLWVAEPYQRQGVAREALRSVVRYGFDELELNRIEARRFARDEATAGVLGSVGMKLEGVLRQAIRKRAAFEDVAVHSLLRADLATP